MGDASQEEEEVIDNGSQDIDNEELVESRKLAGDEDEEDQDESEEEQEEDEEEGEEQLEDEEDSDEMTASDDEQCWISWFVNIRGNNFFCEVDEAYIQDDFNLAGLSVQVPYYDYALDMILDVDFPLDGLSEDQQEIVETASEVLYGLIHARYILTSAGMHKMYDKYANVDFGRCPRSLCQGQPVLPIGLSDITREFSVEVFCPRCHEVYHPRSSKHSNIDGAYFGTTFCHLFLLTHPELVVPKTVESFTPRIFGFRIHDSSQYYKLREPQAGQKRKAGTKAAMEGSSVVSGGVKSTGSSSPSHRASAAAAHREASGAAAASSIHQKASSLQGTDGKF